MKLEITFNKDQIKRACLQMIKDKFGDLKLEFGEITVDKENDRLCIRLEAETR